MMGCVPTKMVEASIVRVGDSVVGGLGPWGRAEARFEDMVVCFAECGEECS